PTEGRGQGGAPAHGAGAGPAELGAVATSPDAVGHLGVADAGVAAVLALLGTGDSGVDAALVRLVGHAVLLEGSWGLRTTSARPDSRSAARHRSRRGARGPSPSLLPR